MDIKKKGDIKKFINDITAHLYEKIQANFTEKLQESTRFIEGKIEEKTGKLQEQLVRLENIIEDLKKRPIQPDILLNIPLYATVAGRNAA